MKLISWNVNGIRAAISKNFHQFVKDQDPDILCLQEIKAQQEQVEHELKDYHEFWYSAQKKGYSGTAIFSKEKPLSTSQGMGLPEHDNEGRVLTAEFSKYYLVNVYTPNSQRELTRLDYRVTWDKLFLKYVKSLEQTKPVIFCGDLNVAHKEIDIARPKENRMNAGFTDQEREGFNNIVDAGFIDTFRMFNDQPNNYTWWSYMMNARARNIGWRIDYFCASQALRPILKDAWIMPQVMGSDHCPVGLVLK